MFHTLWCLAAQRKGMVINMKSTKIFLLIVAFSLLLSVTSCAPNNKVNNQPNGQIKTDNSKKNKVDVSMYDDVLYQDDNVIIVRDNIDTYDKYVIQVGIMDGEGNWLYPLSEDFIFAKAIRDEHMEPTLSIPDTKIDSRHVTYLGEGMFILSRHIAVISESGHVADIRGTNCSTTAASGYNCYLFNINTGQTAVFGARQITHFENGYALMYQSERSNANFFSISSNGTVTELPVQDSSWSNGPGNSGYSDGLFFANGYFYDINGTQEIDLTKYKLTDTPYFMNGQCEIRFVNEGGTAYKAIIDKSGNFISSPEKSN